jgi:hypothetical protein
MKGSVAATSVVVVAVPEPPLQAARRAATEISAAAVGAARHRSIVEACVVCVAVPVSWGVVRKV